MFVKAFLRLSLDVSKAVCMADMSKEHAGYTVYTTIRWNEGEARSKQVIMCMKELEHVQHQQNLSQLHYTLVQRIGLQTSKFKGASEYCYIFKQPKFEAHWIRQCSARPKHPWAPPTWPWE